MPRSFTFADIAAYKAAKASGGSIYAALIGDATLKSGAVVSKITATGDVLIDALNPFVTPNLATNDDILYYSSTEGYRSLRKGKTTWDANSLGQIYIDTSRLPSGFAVVAEYNDIFSFKSMQGETTGSGRSKMTSIRGNSVAWNQSLPMFSSSSWMSTNSTTTYQNGEATILASRSYGGIVAYHIPWISGHKYLVSIDCKTSVTINGQLRFSSDGGKFSFFFFSSSSGVWTTNKKILNVVQDDIHAYVWDTRSSGRDEFTVKNIYRVDLTLLYGSAIDGLTDEQILAKFEAEFGTGYFDQEDGRILSNAASAMEVTGFNQWDGSGQEGKAVSAINGGIETWAPGIATDYIRVFPNTEYYNNLTVIGSASWGLAYYDANKAYISGMVSSSSAWSTTFTTPVNCYYIRATTKIADKSTAIINLSGPRNGQYEPYKKTIVPLDVTTIRVKSPNIWDEEWEVGAYNDSTGAAAISNVNLRSKNRIEVLPNTEYCFTGGAFRVLFYDASDTFIPNSKVNVSSGGTYTTPSNARYVRFYMSSGYGTTYNHDICINKSDPGFNGKYYPHGSFCLFPEGMRSAGSAYDEIVGNKYIKRVGRVDLGSLQFIYNSTYSLFICDDGIPLAKRPDGTNDVPNLVSTKYTPTSDNTMLDKDKQINIQSNVTNLIRLRIKDSGMDGSNIGSDGKIAALSGSMLDYELDTPEVFELEYPLTPIIYPAKGGTKRILPVNGSSPVTAPFSCMVQPI